ncbi:hypothetical protein GAR05_03371 [Micromonospora saelicesensis]|uniref:Uncharacterized protein n=1 Tax=Micromonospora saelicesensis TaxID=285676 RepID=A0ABX9CH86_9ACTN|nr:hypothetical protein GAR05_03371 [Micromonospora saelicesensis]
MEISLARRVFDNPVAWGLGWRGRQSSSLII